MFGSNRDGGILNLYQNVASGTDPDVRLLTSNTDQVPSSWSVDGRFVVYEDADPEYPNRPVGAPDGRRSRRPSPFSANSVLRGPGTAVTERALDGVHVE